MKALKDKIDVERGRWFRNTTVVAIIFAVAMGAHFTTNYINDINTVKKHVEGAPARIKYYNKMLLEQRLCNELLKKDIKDAAEHRKRLEASINEINKHLKGLQLVSLGPQPKNVRQNDEKGKNKKKG